ncbi:MAG: Peptidyl-prolyl cis-trans isomerase-like 1 [Claussenomyces sp. TS43310]|nr:MAG: Peptidyl-prolyl cis-trans isomerase-like 1 [Claussenomyces sp. TS43310]
MHKLKKIFKHGSSSGDNTSKEQVPASSTLRDPIVTQPGSSTTSAAAPQRGTASSEPAKGVLITTNFGDITVALYADKTPKTCRNFATLADTGKYDNVIFHRIIPGFMIQGGDPTGTGMGGSSIYGGKFEDEIDSSLTHSNKGTLSMANSGPGTNGSQFFITLGPTPHLNGKHTVFGQVVDGMDVVDQIASVQTGGQDRPLQDVKIVKAQSFS